MTSRIRSLRPTPTRTVGIAATLVAASLLLTGCARTTASPAGSPGSGTGDASARPAAQSTAPTPAAPPTLRAYTFPAGMVDGTTYGTKHFSRIEGVIAIPSTPGPHPVAVIVHGSYPGLSLIHI